MGNDVTGLQRAARHLRFATWLSLCVVVVIGAYGVSSFVIGSHGPISVSSASGRDRGWGDDLVVAATCLVFALGLRRLARMLRRMEGGAFFTAETIADLRAFTLFTLVSAIISIVLPTVFALAGALTASDNAGAIRLTFEGGDFFSLLVSGLLFFIARLLAEAQRIADDSSQII